jgi:two-component system chemotaxis response regulator CheB
VIERIRVLVVDDSAFMRTAISRLLSADPRFEVVGQARDGSEAVQLALALRPGVITMDFNMPGLNGAEATRAILARHAAAIVMVSAHTSEGAAETVEALAAGAIDFVNKPDGEVSANLGPMRDELIQKLLTAAGSNLDAVRVPPASAPGSEGRRGAAGLPRSRPLGLRVLAIASSTGGPAALVRLLPSLCVQDFASVLIVQHLPAAFTAPLAAQLAECARFPIREARAGDTLEPGQGLVAPGDRHLVVDRSGRVTLDDSPPVHGVRPAADVTFKSVAQGYGARAVGVVLTGMGRDGALGLAAIKAAGGRTVAQDRASCTVYGMPRAAVEMGVVDEIVSLDRVGPALTKLVS